MANTKEYYAAYRERNREKLRVRAREWARANRPVGQLTPSEAKRGDRNPMWRGGNTPEKKAAYHREWMANNQERVRDGKYRKRFRLSLAEYETMLASQEGTCAICNGIPGRRRLDVDHCHTTGAIRGLLCDICNRAIGMFQDDPDLLRRAAKYLEEHATR